MNIIKNCVWYLHQYLRGTRAVAAMEYAIIVGVIVVGIGVAVTAFQEEIVGLIEDVTEQLKTTREDMKEPRRIVHVHGQRFDVRSMSSGLAGRVAAVSLRRSRSGFVFRVRYWVGGFECFG